MAAERIISALTYEPLESAFAEHLAEADTADRCTWVLAPTNLLALHLQRRAARGAGGVAGVEFLILLDAARRLALPALAARGLRPMPAAAEEVALGRLLGDVPDDSYLAAFREFSNGPAALARAITLLESGLWTPAALAEAAERVGATDPSAPRRLAELAGLWRRLREWKEHRGLFADRDLVRAAGDPDLEPAERPDNLFIYGFYDFNPAQQRLVRRLAGLARRRGAYLLWAGEEGSPAPGFEYAAPTVRFLKEALEADRVEPAPNEARDRDLDVLVGRLFREQSRGAPRDSGTPDGTVGVLSCPGDRSEAEEVTREVLRAARDRGGAAQVGVLMRGTERLGGLLAEATERAGLACFIRGGLPLSETVTGRIAVGLLELADGEGERVAVLDFLALAEVERPGGLSLTALDRITRQSGIIKGRRDWQSRLLSRAEQLQRQAERAEEEPKQRACGRDAELCRAAAAFAGDFFRELRALTEAETWPALAAALHELTDRYAPADEEGAEVVLRVVREMARLQVTGARPQLPLVRRVLNRALGQASLGRGRFQQTGLAATALMAVRGVTFDTVIVPGLVEKQFPRHAPRHALLTELDREELNELAEGLGCGRLPLQKRRPLEERYLFRVAVGSARRSLLLSYSRLDRNSGRPKMPSHFLTEACSALTGGPVSGSDLAEGLPAGLVRRVPMHRAEWAEEELELALDTYEYDAAVFAGGEPGAGRTDYLAALSPNFERALRLDLRRWRRREFGPYDGKIRDRELLEHLAEQHGRFGEPVSPTRLETYARCPFSYFLNYVLGAQELEAPSEEFELPPLERGLLVHDLLREVFEDGLRGRRFADLSEPQIEAIVDSAAGVLRELGSSHAQNHPGTWAGEMERTLEQLRALLHYEKRNHPEAAPERFEWEFGYADDEPLSLRLDGDRAIPFHGRIDRVDRLGEGAIQVVDYKTGAGSGLRKNTLLGGTQLQLPIYLLAALRAEGDGGGRALYLLIRGPREVPVFDAQKLEERRRALARALRLIVGGIAGGDFFPFPFGRAERYCSKYCPGRVACGAARRTLAEMKSTDPDAARLHELWDIE